MRRVRRRRGLSRRHRRRLSRLTPDPGRVLRRDRVIRHPDTGKLAGRAPAGWSRQELILNSLFLVIVVYWMLPEPARPALTDIASLLQGVDAVMSLLRS